MHQIWIGAIVALLAGCTEEGGPIEGPEEPEPMVDRFTSGERLVIAHRGGRGIGPDHTIETFQAGLDLGADVLELDVASTADGEIVVIHDLTVDRTTEGTGRVIDFTLAELQQLDAGYTWSPDGGQTFPFRGQGQVVPTMREVFETFPDEWYVIEIKQADPPMVQPFLEIIEEFGLQDRTIVASFSDEVIQEVRTSDLGVRTSFGEGEATNFVLIDLATLDTYEPPAELLQLPPSSSGIPVLTDVVVERAERFGLPIHAWTINEREQMDELLELGVVGLITDWPDRARAAIDAL